MTPTTMPRRRDHPAIGAPARTLIGILGVAGIAHFAAPQSFDEIVPRVLPGTHRMWTYASGIVELGIATTVAVPRSRQSGALLAAVLFVAVFPANIQMAIDWSDRPLPQRLLAYARLPLQIPLIWLACQVARRLSTSPEQEAAPTGAGFSGDDRVPEDRHEQS